MLYPRKNPLKKSKGDKVVEECKKIIAQGDTPNLYRLQVNAGYSPFSARSYAVYNTVAWRKSGLSKPGKSGNPFQKPIKK